MSIFSVPEWQHGHEPCLYMTNGKYWSDPKGVRIEDLGGNSLRAQVLAARLMAGTRVVLAQHSMSIIDARSIMERFTEPLAVLVGWTVYERPFGRLDINVWSPVLPHGRVLAIGSILSGSWSGDMRLCVNVLLRGGTLFLAPRADERGVSIACAVYATDKRT